MSKDRSSFVGVDHLADLEGQFAERLVIGVGLAWSSALF